MPNQKHQCTWSLKQTYKDREAIYSRQTFQIILSTLYPAEHPIFQHQYDRFFTYATTAMTFFIIFTQLDINNCNKKQKRKKKESIYDVIINQNSIKNHLKPRCYEQTTHKPAILENSKSEIQPPQLLNLPYFHKSIMFNSFINCKKLENIQKKNKNKQWRQRRPLTNQIEVTAVEKPNVVENAGFSACYFRQ